MFANFFDDCDEQRLHDQENKTKTRDLEKLESVPNATQYYSILLNICEKWVRRSQQSTTAHPILDDMGNSHSIDGITGKSGAATPTLAP